uniref:Pentatricopeptide repeat-containing protein n=1 Tax=Tanacetum cinerariifolium TaxID=118510 RepID=A0A6L2J818_TANCI|nr:pentatricopeptide repeat-containing protein [Tanacetum cinerariifolium]
MNYINAKFKSIGFECLFKINDKIVPRFVLEFYSQLEFYYNSEGHFVVNFFIQNKPFSFTLEEFGNILGIPSKDHCSYSDKWSIDYMEISSPTKGRYQTTPPSPSVIKTLIQTPGQGLVTRVHNKKTINVDDNEILNREIQHHMSSWVDIIHENVFCLGGHRDHVPAYAIRHGMKRCRSSNPSLSSNILDHPSSSRHTNENNDGNNEESFPSNLLLSKSTRQLFVNHRS